MHMAATAAYHVAPPESFDFRRPEDWPKWARRFERFRKASGLDSKAEEVQVNTLLYSMGDTADDVLRSFKLSEEDAKHYETVVGKFEQHFVRRRNVIYERARFNQRSQEPGESANTFITALFTLAEHCGYAAMHDEMIRDRIVVGLRDARLSEKMQLEADLTLEKAITQARQAESIKQQQLFVRGTAEGPSPRQSEKDVGAVSKGRRSPRIASDKKHPKPDKGQAPSCGWCGKSPTHPKRLCPAKDATCHKCSKRGHFQSVCRSAKVSELHINSPPEEVTFLGALTKGSPGGRDSPWTVQLSLNGKPTKFEIDTGAEVTVISPKTYRAIGSPSLHPPTKALRGPSNNPLQVKGQFTANLGTGRREVEQELFVVEGLHKQLLGRPAIQALELAVRVHGVQESNLSPVARYPSLFRGLGKLEGDYSIQLEEGAKPYAMTVPRRVAIPLLKSIKEELTRMVKLGVISPVKEPTAWCAGMVVVPKRDQRVRICVDLTHLNKSVRRERHPIPAVEQSLAQLAGAQMFTTLDANSGFWQIPLDQESALLTTFITPFGRYCFHRLPFGITSAPEHFQRRMSDLLAGLERVVCMMDDILIHGRSMEEHDARLEKVLQRLQSAGLTLNSQKCHFSKVQVKFLGQVVNKDGVLPDPDKVRAIQEVQPPKTVSDVRRFLGMCNHLSKFSPTLAEKTKPLRELLNKNNHWTWGEPQQTAFVEVKQAMITSPVLSLFDQSRETVVSADASSYGLGAVLLQKQPDNELKPISYISRSLTPTEQRYAQIEKEALAFTWACERFSDFLLGLDFHILTDHKPLVPLFGGKNLDDLPLHVQRFRLRMMRFKFTISHVPGKDLLMADALSRAPCSEAREEDLLFEKETGAYVCLSSGAEPASNREAVRANQTSPRGRRRM